MNLEASSIELVHSHQAESNQFGGKRFDSNNIADELKSGSNRNRVNGLWNGIFLGGTAGDPSSEYDTKFREGNPDEDREGLESYLSKHEVSTANPKMLDWKYEHIDAEAQACRESSVLFFGFDIDHSSKSPEATNGGMGTLAEVNMRVPAAILRGQKVVVAFRKGYADTLTDPQAAVFYQYTLLNVLKYQEKFPDYITLIEDDTAEFAKGREEALSAMKVQQNEETCLSRWSKKDLQAIVEKRNHRLNNLRPTDQIVVGGSGTVSAEHAAERQKIIEELNYSTEAFGMDVFALSKGPIAAAWEDLYSDTSKDRSAFFKQARKCIEMEEAIKEKAPILVWFVDNASASPMALAEVGNFLGNMILKNSEDLGGQLLIAQLEPFNPDAYIENKFSKKQLILELEEVHNKLLQGKIFSNRVEENDMTTLAHEWGKHLKDAHAILELFGKEDFYKKMSKNPLLKLCPTFRHVDNMRRIRAIESKQLQTIVDFLQEIKLEFGIELAIIGQNSDEVKSSMQVVKSKKDIQKREEYFGRYRGFLDQIKKIPSSNGSYNIVNILKKALLDSLVDGKETVEKGLEHLDRHLKEVSGYSKNVLTTFAKDLHLTNRQQILLVDVVAPLHDILKALGDIDSNMQAVSDHQQFITYIIKQFGTKLGLSDEDVVFVVEVIGDHENLFNENGRDEWISSEDPIKESKAVFFIADVFTEVFVFDQVDQNKQLEIDEEKLQSRFIDLASRHVDKAGKVFRPEWILFTLNDVQKFFDFAESKGVAVADKYRQMMSLAGLEAIDRALEKSIFTEYEQRRVLKVQEELVKQVGEPQDVALAGKLHVLKERARIAKWCLVELRTIMEKNPDYLNKIRKQIQIDLRDKETWSFFQKQNKKLSEIKT